MTHTIAERVLAGEEAAGRESENIPGRRRGLWPVVLLLAGYTLFCHGCHGNEDNELFVRAGAAVAGSPQARRSSADEAWGAFFRGRRPALKLTARPASKTSRGA